MPSTPELMHGTIIAHGDFAALIRGPSGAGKSDLALRCLAQAPCPLFRGPIRLVADDYGEVLLEHDGLLSVRAPKTLSGKLEVRGLGVIDIQSLDRARLVMIVELVPQGDVERLPDPMPCTCIQGVRLPILKLHAFDNSASVKLLIMLARGGKLPEQS